MRLISLLGLVIPVLLSTQHTHAQIKNAKTATVKIFGNTPAVKTIIEKEGKDGQFAKVDWNQTTKLAVVTYDSSKTSADEVLKRIALAGFDNEKFLAPDDAYVQLAKAEQYERALKPALKNGTEHQVDHTNHSQGVQTTIQPSANTKSADEKTAFAQLTNLYFALKDALVKTDAVAAAAQAEAFQAAIKAVDMNKLSHDEHTVWMKVMNKLATDAAGITKNKDVAKQRVAFASLSNTLYELLKVSKVDGPIYYQHCPMFNEGKGAHWLSKENAVKNPFFGAQMISCGSTVETLN
ncbi:DUF3347 domain-containing protein [Sphingobacterium sp.]|uniref:DUF3347 domain-containing protein n=1 Tax=Sphingobacterium sp. TaxID=341027 RepID=UPI00258DE4C6|nr:DUF3347 domain-containing protein [Sphingobacterium sp.]WET70061.1 MAG: DUF3347 domain-containing protein [Sphingobacterium sp.]